MLVPVMNWNTFWTLVARECASRPERRYGQNIFNILNEWDSELAAECMVAGVDPYYHDADSPVIIKFIEWLSERLD